MFYCSSGFSRNLFINILYKMIYYYIKIITDWFTEQLIAKLLVDRTFSLISAERERNREKGR